MNVPRVLYATSELAPLVKTGGLADVAASLPAALVREHVDVRVVMPAYRVALRRAESPRRIVTDRLDGREFSVFETRLPGGFLVWLVACDQLFDRDGGPYADEHGRDWPDNADRFAWFSRCVAWLASDRAATGFHVSVLHLNDWQTGLAAALLSEQTPRPRTVFTIHNLEYQGVYDRRTFDRLRLPETLWSQDGIEFHGQMSFIKGGLSYADTLTTVSPTYAREVQTSALGCGLDGLLTARSARLLGILNGIDRTTWDPSRDAYLPVHYDVASLENKLVNRRALAQELSLVDDESPVLGMVSRLIHQKGIDLVIQIIDALVAIPVRLIVLGTGDAEFEAMLASAAARHPHRVAFVCGYDERLAHLIEGGADVFLMPSRYEPCGLNQMYSMAYGTVPVVRRTGGLADTVEPVIDGDGAGFVFDEPTPEALLGAVEAAIVAFASTMVWRRIQHRGMARDFSWAQSARAYANLFRQLLESTP